MTTHRIERVNRAIRQELSELIRKNVKDPRLGELVSITDVETSPDLRSARVYVSAMVEKEQHQQTLNVLKAVSGFLRKELAHNLRLRRIPELTFHWDDSIERGDRLARLIDQVSHEEK